MGEEPDLDLKITSDFFEDDIVQLDPSLMTENGIKCYDRFLKINNRSAKSRAYLKDDLEHAGQVYHSIDVLSCLAVTSPSISEHSYYFSVAY